MLFRLLVALAATASAATIKINVGQSGLTFTPDYVTAAKGDVLEFHFVGGNHDAVAGDFTQACQPLASAGFASGSVAGSASNVRRHLHLLLVPVYHSSPLKE